MGASTDYDDSNTADPTTGFSTDIFNDYYDYDYDYDYEYYFGGLAEETKEQEYEIEEAVRATLALENDSTIVEMGHQFEDFVFECSFRGYDCRCVINAIQCNAMLYLPTYYVPKSYKRASNTWLAGPREAVVGINYFWGARVITTRL